MTPMLTGMRPASKAAGAAGGAVGYRLLLSAGAGAILLAIIAVLALLLADSGSPAKAPAARATPTATPTLAIPAIYQRLLPSMVIIRTPRELGAGFIVADNGTILTANHVIAGAKRITVTFADGTTAAATIASANPKQDTATLIPAKLPQIVVPANLGGNPAIGTEVVAIGNPLGLDYSVSSGVVSGVNRTASHPRRAVLRAHPVRRGSQRRKLRRPPGGRARAGRRHRRLDRRPGAQRRVRGHRLRRAHRDGHRGRRPRERTADLSLKQEGTPMTASPRPAEHAGPLEPVLFEVKRAIVGQDILLERMAVALLSGGHLLVEGVPGLAKTLAVKSLAAAIGGQFQRVQFTPDLVPADLVGTRVYHQRTGEFATHLGPVFTNLLLADEINRAPAKVQSALLEVMQEHQVTIGRETFRVPEPFLVMATQNPIESEGTYPLPEAQVDRFMMKVVVGYPSRAEEHAIVDRSLRPAEPIRAMLSPENLIGMQQQALQVYVDPAVVEYAVRLVAATRDLDGRRAGGPGPVRELRGQPPGLHRLGHRRAGAGVLARPRLRPAARPGRARPGRAAAPRRALV